MPASGARKRCRSDSSEAQPSEARIVLFGDSITQQAFGSHGFGTSLAERYQRRADVLNRGYSGYNTSWALELLPRLRDTPGVETRLVTVFFGANDASLVEHNARQHYRRQAPCDGPMGDVSC